MAVRFYRDAGPYRGRSVNFAGYDFHRDGIAACAVGPELQRAVGEIARGAQEYAELISPSDTRVYQNSFSSGTRIIPDVPNRQGAGPPMPRWAGYLENDAPNVVLVEVGAQATRRYRVFRRTLEWVERTARD